MISNPRVYHGSPHAFTVAQAKMTSGDYGPGFYFTSDLDEATYYARKNRYAPGLVYACDIELKQPLYYHTVVPSDAWLETGAEPEEFWRQYGVPRASDIYYILTETRYGGISKEAAIRVLRKLGYDGIIVYLKKRVTDKLTDAQQMAKMLGLPTSAAGDTLDVVTGREDADRIYYILFDPSQITCSTSVVEQVR